MRPCNVPWCVALQARGSDYCVLHARFSDLHPVELEPEDYERLETEGAIVAACSDCAGSGDCARCEGDGRVECECVECGNVHRSDCNDCDGSGDCEFCDGSGRRQDASGVVARFGPDALRWHAGYLASRMAVGDRLPTGETQANL
jgi:hypothetical protein